MKRSQWIIGITITLAALLMACGDQIGPGNAAKGEKRSVAVPVTTAGVTQEPLFYEAVGTITARTAGTVASKLMGTVLAVHVNEGSVVKEGDLLVTLDQRQVSAQSDRAEAGLREARRSETSALSALAAGQAGAQLAETTYKRYQQLIKVNSASQQEFDEVEARHRQAQANLAQGQAQLEAARSRVQQADAAVREAIIAKKDALVRAPYAGLVVKKSIAEGDLASPGTPLVTIEQEGVYCAELLLPERFIQEVKLGMPVKVVVDALGKQEIEGMVGRITPSADAASRSFEIKVAMPEGLALKSGMFARVYLPIGGTGMLLVPQKAVISEGQLTGLFIVDETQTARFRLVRLGKEVGDRLEIISGLQSGQQYISEVPQGFKDGAKVEKK
jgi:RND family efflux transporter MFP subunit